jgi:hypothetical protein
MGAVECRRTSASTHKKDGASARTRGGRTTTEKSDETAKLLKTAKTTTMFLLTWLVGSELETNSATLFDASFAEHLQTKLNPHSFVFLYLSTSRQIQ